MAESKLSPPPASRRRTGRPRSEASRRAVLAAAYEILVQRGLGAFSIDAVAERSGVARTTIYRSWPTKGLLAFDSFRDAFEPQIEFLRSAEPVEDVHKLVRSLARALSGPAGRLAALTVAQAQSDRDVQQLFLQQFVEPLRARSAALLQAGIDRGTFRHDLDIPRVQDAFVGATYWRLLLGQPTDPEWAGQLAVTLLNGCLA